MHGAGDTTQSDRGGQHVGITGIRGKQRERGRRCPILLEHLIYRHDRWAIMFGIEGDASYRCVTRGREDGSCHPYCCCSFLGFSDSAVFDGFECLGGGLAVAGLGEGVHAADLETTHNRCHELLLAHHDDVLSSTRLRRVWTVSPSIAAQHNLVCRLLQRRFVKYVFRVSSVAVLMFRFPQGRHTRFCALCLASVGLIAKSVTPRLARDS